MTARVLFLMAVLSLVPIARAHTLSVSHLDIVVPNDGGSLQIELDLSVRDLALTVPLDANRDEKVTWGELQAIQQPLQEWIRSGLAVSSGPSACALGFDSLATRQYEDGTYATIRMHARCPSDDGFGIHYRLLFENDPQHRALITLRNRGSVSTAIVSATQQRLSLGSASRHPFIDFLHEGVHHILIGYDHLAFLISLLLPAALVRMNNRWQAANSLKISVGHVLGIVTAFTLAHSITLSLAALGWITPASRWVEIAIATSVLVAALNNVWPLVSRRLWAVAFLFGLVHGFGFAGALGEVGLPTGPRLQALVGFNLGVELGQLAVVALVLPLLFAARKQAWYSNYIMPLMSLAIAGLAAMWLYQRI